MDRCAESLRRLNHLEQTRRIAVDTTADMHKYRHAMPRGNREDHVSLGVVHGPGHVIEQEPYAQAALVELGLQQAFNLLALGGGGSLSKGRTGHIELARLHQLGERCRVNNLQTNPGMPNRCAKMREWRRAQLLTECVNGIATGLELQHRGYTIQQFQLIPCLCHTV